MRAENGELSRIGINSWLYMQEMAQSSATRVGEIKVLLYTKTNCREKKVTNV